MRIGELAERTNVSVRSLRYYEQQRLLRSSRSSSGQRIFEPASIDRVIQIQELFAAGMCSTKIEELLPCFDAAPGERTGMLDQELLKHRQRLEYAIRDLQRARATLNDVIDNAHAGL
ncbi:MerR family transcriptional regulator [Arthrobacter antioxidans]|uniref:MerR family transcriptional regulator n=1 Tax=Arthrobacter antioxidans TaxID=2895818 RepID=UPI0020004A35|nr:MerR family transcriptional regulator [Arthrobacter antioxidans]